MRADRYSRDRANRRRSPPEFRQEGASLKSIGLAGLTSNATDVAAGIALLSRSFF
jgi:hypothetical protein